MTSLQKSHTPMISTWCTDVGVPVQCDGLGPGAYPGRSHCDSPRSRTLYRVWALLIIVVDFFVVWALVLHGRDVTGD